MSPAEDLRQNRNSGKFKLDTIDVKYSTKSGDREIDVNICFPYPGIPGAPRLIRACKLVSFNGFSVVASVVGSALGVPL